MKQGELFTRVLSWHFLLGRGQEFFDVLGDRLDEIRQWAREGVRASMVTFTPEEALGFLAQNYNLEVPEHFTPAQTRTMVREGWSTWLRAGAQEGVVREVQRLGFRKVGILPVVQANHHSDGRKDTLEIAYTLPKAEEVNPLFAPRLGVHERDIATQGRWPDGWWHELNFHFSSFYVVIHDHDFAFRRWGEWDWGDGGRWDALVTGNRQLLKRIKFTIDKFKDHASSCRGVIFPYGGTYRAGSLFPPFRSITQRAVFSRRSFDTWSVGLEGSIFRWDGVHWIKVPSPTVEDLLGVWVRARDDVWIVGRAGTILHWDGLQVRSVASGTLEDLYAVAGVGGAVWAVGDNGTALRWNGAAWAPEPPPAATNLRGLLALSRTEVWAVGEGGKSLRWNGGAWNDVPTGTAENLHSLWGLSSEEIWAVGANGTILIWNGAGWFPAVSPTGEDLHAVWGTDVSQIFAVGANGTWLHWVRGAPWRTIAGLPAGRTFFGVHGTDAFNIWIVGEDGFQMWGSSENRKPLLYQGDAWGDFRWGDGTKYNLKFALSRMREPWEV